MKAVTAAGCGTRERASAAQCQEPRSALSSIRSSDPRGFCGPFPVRYVDEQSLQGCGTAIQLYMRILMQLVAERGECCWMSESKLS